MARNIGTIELTELAWGGGFWRADVFVFARGNYVRDRVKVHTSIVEGERAAEDTAVAWCALHVQSVGVA